MSDEAHNKKATNQPSKRDQEKIDKYLLSSDADSRDTREIHMAMRHVPLTLQPFFKDQSDLNRELVQRFPNMPLMSVGKFRDLYDDGERGVATLASQDGSASMIVDIASRKTDMQFSFMYGSMLSLRFHLEELSKLDRRAWLDNMQTRIDDIVFLWGQSRWDKDYIICVPHRYYISLLAFSPNNFEAAVRITPSLSKALFGWMHTFWYPEGEEQPSDDDDLESDILQSW